MNLPQSPTPDTIKKCLIESHQQDNPISSQSPFDSPIPNGRSERKILKFKPKANFGQIMRKIGVTFCINMTILPLIIMNLIIGSESTNQCIDQKFMGALTLRDWLNWQAYFLLACLAIAYITTVVDMLRNGQNNWVIGPLCVGFFSMIVWIMIGSTANLDNCDDSTTLYIDMVVIIGEIIWFIIQLLSSSKS